MKRHTEVVDVYRVEDGSGEEVEGSQVKSRRTVTRNNSALSSPLELFGICLLKSDMAKMNVERKSLEQIRARIDQEQKMRDHDRLECALEREHDRKELQEERKATQKLELENFKLMLVAFRRKWFN